MILEHKDNDMIGIRQRAMRVLPNPCPVHIKSSTDVGNNRGGCFPWPLIIIITRKRGLRFGRGPKLKRIVLGCFYEPNGMNTYNLTGGHERVAISLPCQD